MHQRQRTGVAVLGCESGRIRAHGDQDGGRNLARPGSAETDTGPRGAGGAGETVVNRPSAYAATPHDPHPDGDDA